MTRFIISNITLLNNYMFSMCSVINSDIREVKRKQV